MDAPEAAEVSLVAAAIAEEELISLVSLYAENEDDDASFEMVFFVLLLFMVCGDVDVADGGGGGLGSSSILYC